MRKIIVMLVNLLFFTSICLAYPDEPKGYLDFPWETPVKNVVGLTLVKQKGNESIYERSKEGSNFHFLERTYASKRTLWQFKDGKLTGVGCYTSAANAKMVLDYATAVFGRCDEIGKTADARIHLWYGPVTTLAVTAGSDYGRVVLVKSSSTPASNENFGLQFIKFYESPYEGVPYVNRSYNDKFSKSASRYICTEINYINKKYNISDVQLPLKIQYYSSDGSLVGESTANLETSKEWPTVAGYSGIGWREAGIWAIGRYQVKVWFDNVYLGDFYFQIID